MPDELRGRDAGSLWRSQPGEESDVSIEPILSSRSSQLHAATRSEILTSVGAVVFFVAVLVWRNGGVRDPWVAAGVCLAGAWVLVSLYRFRRSVQGSKPDAAAVSCADYYREELTARRDHLRSEWLWHGPLVVACVIFGATLIRRSMPAFQRFWSMAPLIAALAVWAVFGVVRRRRQARELQREIDEIDRERKG